MRQEPSGPSRSDIDLLRLATSGLSSRLEDVLAAHDLTLDGWRVLRSLAGSGPQAMTALAAATRTTGPTLTRVVDRLAERALVYRDVDVADRRRVVVHVSDRGRRTCRSLEPRVAEAERDGLAALSGRETRTLRRLLERIAP